MSSGIGLSLKGHAKQAKVLVRQYFTGLNISPIHSNFSRMKYNYKKVFKKCFRCLKSINIENQFNVYKIRILYFQGLSYPPNTTYFYCIDVSILTQNIHSVRLGPIFI